MGRAEERGERKTGGGEREVEVPPLDLFNPTLTTAVRVTTVWTGLVYAATGHLLEFEIFPRNAGNIREF